MARPGRGLRLAALASATYLAGAGEALAKRKGKTQCRRKSDRCGRWRWLSLVTDRRVGNGDGVGNRDEVRDRKEGAQRGKNKATVSSEQE